MALPTFDEISAVLHAHESELRDMGLEYLAVFGSVARGDANADSDIDFLVTLTRPAGFFEYFDLEDKLAELIPGKHDVIPVNSLRAELRPRVEQDLRRVL